MPRKKSPDIGIDEFLEYCSDICQDTGLYFANVGDVNFTTLTRANLELLRWAREAGEPGIIISFPDFERESLAVAFLGAFQHLIETNGDRGAHEPIAGERVCKSVTENVSLAEEVFISTYDDDGDETDLLPIAGGQ